MSSPARSTSVPSTGCHEVSTQTSLPILSGAQCCPETENWPELYSRIARRCQWLHTWLAKLHAQAEQQDPISYKNAHRLYIGNLPLLTTEEELATFLQHQMLGCLYPLEATVTSTSGPIVVSCKITQSKSFAFVDFATILLATNALILDGVVFHGHALKIRRPSKYDPLVALMWGPITPDPTLDLSGLAHSTLASPPELANKLFIGGLPCDWNEGDVKGLITPLAALRSFNLVMDKVTGKNKGYAFCELANEQLVDIVISSLNQKMVGHKLLSVRRAACPVQPCTLVNDTSLPLRAFPPFPTSALLTEGEQAEDREGSGPGPRAMPAADLTQQPPAGSSHGMLGDLTLPTLPVVTVAEQSENMLFLQSEAGAGLKGAAQEEAASERGALARAAACCITMPQAEGAQANAANDDAAGLQTDQLPHLDPISNPATGPLMATLAATQPCATAVIASSGLAARSESAVHASRPALLLAGQQQSGWAGHGAPHHVHHMPVPQVFILNTQHQGVPGATTPGYGPPMCIMPANGAYLPTQALPMHSAPAMVRLRGSVQAEGPAGDLSCSASVPLQLGQGLAACPTSATAQRIAEIWVGTVVVGAAGPSGSGQQEDEGQGQGEQEVIAERRQVIKAAFRALVEAAQPDLSPAQVDAVVAQVNQRTTMGSMQCCVASVMSLTMLLQSFLGQPTPGFPAAVQPPQPSCPPQFSWTSMTPTCCHRSRLPWTCLPTQVCRNT
ncbi:hypothetical protein V8C86DRAFT_3026703 [Haematococcus lacustris]